MSTCPVFIPLFVLVASYFGFRTQRLEALRSVEGSAVRL